MTPGEKQLWCALYAARIAYWWDRELPEHVPKNIPKEEFYAHDAAEYASVNVGGLRRCKESIYEGWGGLSSERFLRQILDDPVLVGTQYDCHKCGVAVVLDDMVIPNAYNGLCPTCYEENR